MSQVFQPASVSKHFAKDSSCPEMSKILRLYNMKFCPYAQRTRLILAAKRVENEVVNINLANKPDWYCTKNPLGKVPCLEFPDGKILYESLITCDYLDEAHPNNPLNSSDPFQKAQDRIFVELFNKVISNYYSFYKLDLADESVIKAPLDGIYEGLEIFEKELIRRATPFFGGNKPGMLDYMIWPWMERLPMLTLMSSGTVNIALENKMPTLAKWCDGMKKDAAVQESFMSPANHYKYIKSYFAGIPDYDMELE